MMRWQLYIPLLIFVVLASLLYWGLGRDPNAMPSALVDRPVPEFILPALDAPSQTALDASIFAGQVSLLNVWATWCYACRVEHPFLMTLAEQGVPIVGLNYKDDPEQAKHWLTEFGNPYRYNIADMAGSLGLDLGVFGAPETYLVDAQGVIRLKHVGVLDERVWQRKIAPVYQSLAGTAVEEMP